VSQPDQQEEIARLEQINEELTDSLKRCRGLLSTAWSQLAANGNEQIDSAEPPAIRTGRLRRSAD
jgi:hypothetical protein